eukprot:scaffold3002_cov64-Attheya_sp.AAC.4
MWAKRIATLDPTSDSEIPEHPPELLRHPPPVPESSPSPPGEQSHLPQPPSSTHKYGGQTFLFPEKPLVQNDARDYHQSSS